MGKILWFDTETTGLEANKNAIWQLAFLVEIDGELVEEGDLRMSPGKARIDKEALDLNGISKETLLSYESAGVALSKFKQTLKKYVNKFDRTDKFVIAGYNVRFDIDFLRAEFLRQRDKYFGSWFYSAPLDVMSWCSLLPLRGISLKDFKLGTLCEFFNVAIDAHDALSDIKATRNLFNIVRCLSWEPTKALN